MPVIAKRIGIEKKGDSFTLFVSVRYYFNAVQFVEVLPMPAGEQDPKNRFHGAGYNTSNAEAMRRYPRTSPLVLQPR